MDLPPQPKAFRQALGEIPLSVKGCLTLLPVVLPGAFLLVILGYLSRGILNHIHDYQVSNPPVTGAARN